MRGQLGSFSPDLLEEYSCSLSREEAKKQCTPVPLGSRGPSKAQVGGFEQRLCSISRPPQKFWRRQSCEKKWLLIPRPGGHYLSQAVVPGARRQE